MKYHPDPAIHDEKSRHAFLSAYRARNDEEESEAQFLHAKYSGVTGWPLTPRDGPPLNMPWAPSYDFLVELVPLGVNTKLWNKATGTSKMFFQAGHTTVEPITCHMRSLTESQCEQFLAVKKAIVKKEKKPVVVKEEEQPGSLLKSFKTKIDGEWVSVFKD